MKIQKKPLRKTWPCVAIVAGLMLAGCGDDASDPAEGNVDVSSADYVKEIDNKGDASAVAVFLDFELDGQLVTDRAYNPNKEIEEQMLYTIGHLNEQDSVGRLDKLELSNVDTERLDNGDTRITYRAKLLVAWGQKDNVPENYEFVLPRDVSHSGLEDFSDKYSHDCVSWGAHDVTSGSMWYYYRPERSRCNIADEDVVRLNAAVSMSEVNTTGKYPEYHKIWEDDVLKVVAVFGKYKDGATSGSDAGIAAYNRFLRTMKSDLGALDNYASEPAEIPRNPGVSLPDATFRADFGDNLSVEVVALLVDNVRTAGADFDARYSELTPDADLIVYNGHAGLGSNIRAMARKGEWKTGQYSIVFMNGCDTYAYVDTALADARSAINEDDPNGTKYLDIITNAMPSFFREMSQATNALIRGLMSVDDPRTFEKMFEDIDESEVVLVSGEQDNEYVPGSEGGGEVVEGWEGLGDSGTIARDEEARFSTPRLREGRYVFTLSGDGDADLYVRVGNEPTTEEWDCRPYRTGSRESCLVELSAPTQIHVMVRGWNDSSNFELIGALE